MAKNTFLESQVIDDVFDYIDFYEMNYRYNAIGWKEYLKCYGKKRLNEFDCKSYGGKIVLVTRTFQNFDYHRDGRFAYEADCLEEYAQSLLDDILDEISIKPELILTDFGICPDTLSLHFHAMLFLPAKVRKAELIKIAPSLNFKFYNIDNKGIHSALWHCKRDEAKHEPVLKICKREKENSFKPVEIEDVYYSEFEERVKKIVRG